ncbi:hypothetical protein ACFOPI_13660 [Hydrogenophaga luteola]|uniref:AlgX/AlgJ SGNH hydrolase-like domain-containing protein n=2 Tax=Hydrogenophaga luteola TaxID=1591122 RepID=A0ABV7W7N0_9BURK
MLLATLLGLAVLPLLNGWLVTPPPGTACCSVDRWFSSEPLLRAASAVLYRVGISVAPHQVVVGRDGWLYLGDEQSASLTTHRRAGRASDIRLGQSYGEGARRWDAYLRSRGVQAFRILVAPDKETVYPGHLPQWALPPSAPGVADTLLAHTGTDLFVDSREVLGRAATTAPSPLFYRHDTHWNPLGASHAFAALERSLRADLPYEVWPSADERRLLRLRPRAGGDLADSLRLGAWLTDTEPVLAVSEQLGTRVHRRYASSDQLDPTRVADSRVIPTFPVETHHDQALNTRRVLWLTDSFGKGMDDLMHRSFGQVVTLHWRDVHKHGGQLVRLIDEVRPELLIVTVVERALATPAFASVLQYPPGMATGEPDASLHKAELLEMSGVEHQGDGFRTTSGVASLTFRLARPVAGAGGLSLRLICEDRSAALPVQVFWRGAHQPRFHRDQSVRWLHVGAQSSLDRLTTADGRPAEEMQVLRLDLRGQGHCREFRLQELALRSASAAAETGERPR